MTLNSLANPGSKNRIRKLEPHFPLKKFYVDEIKPVFIEKCRLRFLCNDSLDLAEQFRKSAVLKFVLMRKEKGWDIENLIVSEHHAREINRAKCTFK